MFLWGMLSLAVVLLIIAKTITILALTLRMLPYVATGEQEFFDYLKPSCFQLYYFSLASRVQILLEHTLEFS